MTKNKEEENKVSTLSDEALARAARARQNERAPSRVRLYVEAYACGGSYEEIAAQFGVSRQTVSQSISRYLSRYAPAKAL